MTDESRPEAVRMVRIALEMPEGVLASQELRLMAAVKWHEFRLISQERAAEIAGLSRSEFLDVLDRLGVSPFQYEADEILAEADPPDSRLAARGLRYLEDEVWPKALPDQLDRRLSREEEDEILGYEPSGV
jgi:predicted HTH domain antitoxin